MDPLVRASACLLTVLLGGPAFAGGYYYSDSGIIATGRGGAWVAGADTQFAQHFNPAGLIRIDAPTVNVGMSGVQQNVSFERMKPEGAGFYPAVENGAAPFLVPQLGFATPLVDQLALAVGFYSPFAPSSLYEPDGPQRYSIIDTGIYQFSVGPSLAWQPIPQLTIGLGIAWQYLQVNEKVALTIDGTDDPAGDIGVTARVIDPFTPGWNAGILIEPLEMLSIGLAVTPPTKFRGRGPGRLNFQGNSLETFLQETHYSDEVVLNLALPLELRAGVAVRPMPRLELEVATVYQRWSTLDDILIEEVDIEVEPTEDVAELIDLLGISTQVDEELVLPASLNDTWSIRLGGEVRVLDELELRAGGFYETSALDTSKVSVALVDTNKVQLGAGASTFLLRERLRFDVAFAWLLFQSLEVRDSNVTQIDAGVYENTEPLVVGNGNLRSHGWVLGGQAQWAFRGKP